MQVQALHDLVGERPLPLLLLSFLSGAAQKWVVRFFARYSRIINVIGGLLLLGVGLYGLISDWDLIKTYLDIWSGQ